MKQTKESEMSIIQEIKNNREKIVKEKPTITGPSSATGGLVENNLTNLSSDIAISQSINSSSASFKLDPMILAEIGIQARKAYPKLDQKVIDKIITDIESALNPIYSQYLTVCKTNNGEGEIDVAILQALLKANSKDTNSEISIQSQLRLALKWNRIDIAKDYILTDDNKAIMGSLDNLMFTAIKDNRFEFVELFLDNGFSLKSFLTYRALLKLYNEVDTFLTI